MDENNRSIKKLKTSKDESNQATTSNFQIKNETTKCQLVYNISKEVRLKLINNLIKSNDYSIQNANETDKDEMMNFVEDNKILINFLLNLPVQLANDVELKSNKGKVYLHFNLQFL